MVEAERKVAAPGEVVLQVPSQGQLRLGPGLVCQEEQVTSTRAGVLRQNANGKQVWLESRQRRYIPAEGDVVVGTVVDRHGENFTVDIGAPFFAQLPQLSFEGATRRNRPAIKPGDLVYARIVSASRDTEPILSCIDSLGRASGFGHLKDGLLVQLNTWHARQLLANPPPAVLQALGASLQFEMVVGLNGRVWVHVPASTDPNEIDAKDKKVAVLVALALQKAEFLTDQQARTLVQRMLPTVQ